MADVTWMTTKEYAEKMRKHEQSVRDLCASGEIEAVKVGSVWRIPYVEPAQLQAVAQVSRLVDAICEDCVVEVDKAIGKLTRMRETLMEEMMG